MVSDGTAPYHAVYSTHERHYTMNPSLLAANNVKLVASINRLKEMKPLVSIPTGIVFNSAYWTYSR
jgi:hypothetical protein